MIRNHAKRLTTWLIALASLVGMPIAVMAAAVQKESDKAVKPLILVHYMPWFAAKSTGPNWGWHWTMNAFDPQIEKDGKRSIAAHYYPLIGPYDSGDPAVIEYHLLLMKLAGIDGLIPDWYGLSDHFDYATLHRNTEALFEPAAKLGLKIGICYEDQTISQLVTAKKLDETNRVPHARQEIEWLRQNWFPKPAYLKLDDKPVLLSFGNGGLTDSEWEQVLPPDARGPLYFSEHQKRSVAVGAFDWPLPQNGLAALDRFYQHSKDWPMAMPVAFPRFHDIYAEAKVQPSWGRIEDNNGQTFTTTFRRALQSGFPLVQIATWNDWGEGTVIEPSLEFGYRDLEAIQKHRRELVDAKFSYTADDLRLPRRLFELRRQQAQQPQLKDKLDEIARLLGMGALPQAHAALRKIEAISGRKVG